jgi:hypothetical protein
MRKRRRLSQQAIATHEVFQWLDRAFVARSYLLMAYLNRDWLRFRWTPQFWTHITYE